MWHKHLHSFLTMMCHHKFQGHAYEPCTQPCLVWGVKTMPSQSKHQHGPSKGESSRIPRHNGHDEGQCPGWEDEVRVLTWTLLNTIEEHEEKDGAKGWREMGKVTPDAHLTSAAWSNIQGYMPSSTQPNSLTGWYRECPWPWHDQPMPFDYQAWCCHVKWCHSFLSTMMTTSSHYQTAWTCHSNHQWMLCRPNKPAKQPGPKTS